MAETTEKPQRIPYKSPAPVNGRAKKKPVEVEEESEVNKGGRPSNYDQYVHPLAARFLIREGLTQEQIAKEFGISQPTLNRWMRKYPEFKQAIKMDRTAELETVVSSLYSLTQGIDITETRVIEQRKVKGKVLIGKDDKGRDIHALEYGDEFEVIRREIVNKRTIPSERACEFFLANKGFGPLTAGKGWRRSDPPPDKAGGDDMSPEEYTAKVRAAMGGMHFSVTGQIGPPSQEGAPDGEAS